VGLTKNIIKYTIVLTCVASISAGIVTFASEVTTPILEQRAQDALDFAMNVTLAQNYDNIESYEEIDSKLNGTGVNNLYKVSLTGGKSIYVYNIANTGKNGLIKFLLAYDEQGTVDSIIYISHGETPGRGDKVTKEPFLSQIIGQNMNNVEIDTISGATISSKAVKNGVVVSSQNLKNEVLK
jgi:Na+-translocating ferredoxin:NAD+ oxidoreductase subunit G